MVTLGELLRYDLVGHLRTTVETVLQCGHEGGPPVRRATAYSEPAQADP